MKKKRVLMVVGLAFVFIIVGCWYFSNLDAYGTVANINENKVVAKENILSNKVLDWQDYYNNRDIVGNVVIDGISDFNYPVVQTNDNNYYLNHNYSKEFDKYGAIYADYRVDLDSSKKVLIYGHSSTKKEVPFNKLENYYDSEYYKEHKYITLNTETNSYRYEIFSVYVETNDFTYMNVNFDDNEDWYLHLLSLQKKSMYQIDVDLSQDDDILILQTCSNHLSYQQYKNKYLLIISRRVK